MEQALDITLTVNGTAVASGSASGAKTTAAISQRQKLSVIGSNASRRARPMTQFPAQNRLASASSPKAVAREPNKEFFIFSGFTVG